MTKDIIALTIIDRGEFVKVNRRFLVVVLAIVIITSSIGMIVYDSRENETSPDLGSSAGIQVGDRFVYNITGTCNGKIATGSVEYNLTEGIKGYSMRALSSNDVLDDLLLDMYPDWRPTYVQVEETSIVTSYGVKQVVATFDVKGCYAIISYVGTNPAITYGYTVNSPTCHLDIVLIDTNNADAVTKNEDPFHWERPDYPSSWKDTFGANFNIGGAYRWGTYEISESVPVRLNITGENVTVLVYNEGNIRSMTEGGPYSCNMNLSHIGSGNATSIGVLSKGFVVIFCHAETNDAYGSLAEL